MTGPTGVRCAECGLVTLYREMYKAGLLRLNHKPDCGQREVVGHPVKLYYLQSINPSHEGK